MATIEFDTITKVSIGVESLPAVTLAGIKCSHIILIERIIHFYTPL